MEIVERQNTIFCIFDMCSPTITAFNIRESIHAQQRLQEEDIRMIQINGPRRQVYIKIVSAERINSIFQNIQGQKKYKHDNDEISILRESFNDFEMSQSGGFTSSGKRACLG